MVVQTLLHSYGRHLSFESWLDETPSEEEKRAVCADVYRVGALLAVIDSKPRQTIIWHGGGG